MVAGSRHFGHVVFHGQFTVYMEAEIADDGGRLDLRDEPMRIEPSELVILARLAREPTHMASVLSAFSCKRRDLHHELMSSAQRDKRERSVSVSFTRYFVNRAPGAYCWASTQRSPLAHMLKQLRDLSHNSADSGHFFRVNRTSL